MMMKVLAKFTHRDGYSVYVDPMEIERTGRDPHGPTMSLRDGTVLKLMQVIGSTAVRTDRSQAILAAAH